MKSLSIDFMVIGLESRRSNAFHTTKTEVHQMKYIAKFVLILLLVSCCSMLGAANETIQGVFLVGDKSDPIPGSPYTPEMFAEAKIKLVETVKDLQALLNANKDIPFIGILHAPEDYLRYREEIGNDILGLWKDYADKGHTVSVIGGKNEPKSPCVIYRPDRVFTTNIKWSVPFNTFLDQIGYNDARQELIRHRKRLERERELRNQKQNTVPKIPPGFEESVRQMQQMMYRLMPKWNYLVLSVEDFTKEGKTEVTTSLQEKLRELGEEGWELVSMDNGILVFKRPLLSVKTGVSGGEPF